VEKSGQSEESLEKTKIPIFSLFIGAKEIGSKYPSDSLSRSSRNQGGENFEDLDLLLQFNSIQFNSIQFISIKCIVGNLIGRADSPAGLINWGEAS